MEVWAERRVKSKGESRKEETGEEWLPQLDILNFFMGDILKIKKKENK